VEEKNERVVVGRARGPIVRKRSVSARGDAEEGTPSPDRAPFKLATPTATCDLEVNVRN